MSAVVDLSVLDSMTEEQREAFYMKLREDRLAAGKKDPRTPRSTTRASGAVQVIARANDNARAALANERTTTRLAETWDNWRDALVTYAGKSNINIPPAEEYDSSEAHVSAILPLLPADFQTRLTESRDSSRAKMVASREKIQAKLKGRNTQAEGRSRRSRSSESTDTEE